MQAIEPSHVDCLEAGNGPLVVLVHSSVAGARQWRKLMDVLAPSFHVKALNLFGYGATPHWLSGRSQTLDDQASLVAALLSDDGKPVSLVGHSFGGAIAMKAALRLGSRVGKLVLLEPNPFFLLRDNGRMEAFAEIMELCDVMKRCGASGDWMIAAERFGDYWGGSGTWAATSAERRLSFIDALRPNFHEWDAVMGEMTALATWAAGLPQRTLVVHDPATVRPIREIVELLRASTRWRFETIAEGGHMAPLTRPDLVNPIVEKFLKS